MARTRREADQVRSRITEGIAEYCETRDAPRRMRCSDVMVATPAWKTPTLFAAPASRSNPSSRERHVAILN